MANTTVEKVMILMKTELFAEVPTQQLLYLAAISRIRHQLEGEYLFREGEPSMALYVILSGEITVIKNDLPARIFKKESILAEMGFFDNSPCIGSAVCSQDSKLLVIERSEFFDLFRDCVEISHGILKFYIRHYRYLLELISDEDLLPHLVQHTDMSIRDI